MITEQDIANEVKALNDIANKLDKSYEYKRGNNGQWALFDVKELNENSVYRPVYLSDTPAGFFAYVSLLKNIYKKGNIPE